MFIYKLTNKTTLEFYVGKTTKNLKDRLKWHINYSKRPSAQTHIARAIRKYGENNFIIEVIERVDVKEILEEREKHWISILTPGYNMTEGGEGGSTTHNRIWITNGVDNKYIYRWDEIPEGYKKGRLCKFNDKEFQKEMSRRSKLSPKYKESMKYVGAKISEVRKKKYWALSGDKSPAKRPEVRKKISEARKKPITLKGLNFSSCGEASLYFNVNRGTITRWLKNESRENNSANQ